MSREYINGISTGFIMSGLTLVLSTKVETTTHETLRVIEEQTNYESGITFLFVGGLIRLGTMFF